MTQLGYRTLRENIVEVIRLKILNEELKPGMRIVEQELSDELGVSRGPIREALRQLEQEGMVEYKRNAGCSVRKILLEDIYEIYLLRSTYEKLAVQICRGQFTDEELEKMDDILKRMKNFGEEDYRHIVELDCKLHKIIVEKAKLPRMMKSWEELNYGDMLSCYAGEISKEETARRQYPIHKRLVDACKTKDTDIICKAISKHYMLTINRLLEEKEGLQKDESMEI